MMNPLLFRNNSLALDVNLIFVCKIDTDLKSVIEFSLVISCAFKKGVIGWKLRHILNFCFFPFPYLYLNRV